MALYKRLFIPDCHFPNHDEKAFSLMLDAASDFKPHEVVILGDFQDAYSVSSYDKNPARSFSDLKEELKPGREMLDVIERRLKTRKIVYIEGNHEERITRYIHTYASVLHNSLSTRDILEIPNYYKYLPYGQKNKYRFDDWIATHGDLCGQYPAGSMVKKYMANVIFGHVHQCQTHHIRDVHGNVYRGVTCGWLGDMENAAEYIKSHANWSHGFAIGFSSKGKTNIQTIEITNYRLVYGGNFYETKNSPNRL